MSKVEVLSKLMESMYEFERIMQSYQNTPRYYGTEDLLYMTETHAIQEIGRNPGQTLAQLAEKTYRTDSAMSLIIKNLSKKDLVSKVRSEEDNRRYEITLTEKGKIVYEFHEGLDIENSKVFLDELEKQRDYKVEDYKIISEFLETLNDVISKFLEK